MLALITGGNRGIGAAIAHKLAENGIDVIIVGKNKRRLHDAAASLKKLGVIAHFVQFDISKEESIKKLVKRVAEIGDIDVLINNAGTAYYSDVIKINPKEIDEMIDVNLRSLIKITKAFLPRMIRKRESMVINIASGAGKTGYPGLATYCATKFGVIGFTEGLAQEVENMGVRVYAVCPGDTQTDMWDSLFPGEPATYVPEDVAIEVLNLIKNSKKVTTGKAVDVRKHV
jgi:short-subunit dehydrogenase